MRETRLQNGKGDERRAEMKGREENMDNEGGRRITEMRENGKREDGERMEDGHETLRGGERK